MKSSILNLKSALLVLTVMASSSAFAYQPLVVCGASDPAGSTELDLISGNEGGSANDQLVIRNTNILNYFESMQAIYAGELNAKGEFILDGLSFNGASSNSFAGEINNRHFSFQPNGNNSFTLTVSYTDSNFHEVTLADFTFQGCQINL